MIVDILPVLGIIDVSAPVPYFKGLPKRTFRTT
jgi:hypothetical protein